ncbi:MAG: zinc ribbon domain-containing protein [Anaerolineae bacterium]|nr:zinc ribbon domain-containing protein [Anaerolineae bacterium]
MEGILQIISQVIFWLTLAAGVIFTALHGGAIIWTFRDMRARSRDFLALIVAVLLVALIPIFGFIVYLMLRPRDTLAEAYERSLEQEALLQAIEEPELCPGCSQRVKADYLLCPTCHTRLKQPCIACGRPLHLNWAVCPYCGHGATPQVVEPSQPLKEEREAL